MTKGSPAISPSRDENLNMVKVKAVGVAGEEEAEAVEAVVEAWDVKNKIEREYVREYVLLYSF